MKRIVFIVSLMLVGFVIWPYGELRYGTLIDDHPSFYVVTWACRLFMVCLLAWLAVRAEGLNRKISA